MDFENLKCLLNILSNALEKEDFGEDEQKIQYFYDELEKLENELPTSEKLEELQKIEIDLEIKYENFYELNYYFDPFYIKMKKTIHENEVKKLREENKKRGIK